MKEPSALDIAALVVEIYGPEPSPELLRAVENLRLVEKLPKSHHRGSLRAWAKIQNDLEYLVDLKRRRSATA